MSPISSDEEYLSDKSDEDGDITGHDIVTEVDTYTDPTSSSQLESHDHTTAVTLYKLCGDNIDKTVHQRYHMVLGHYTISILMPLLIGSISPISLKKPSPQEVSTVIHRPSCFYLPWRMKKL